MKFLRLILGIDKVDDSFSEKLINTALNSIAAYIVTQEQSDIRQAVNELEAFLINLESKESFEKWIKNLNELLLDTLDPRSLTGAIYYRKCLWWR